MILPTCYDEMKAPTIDAAMLGSQRTSVAALDCPIGKLVLPKLIQRLQVANTAAYN
jgi:hypothetical protein